MFLLKKNLSILIAFLAIKTLGGQVALATDIDSTKRNNNSQQDSISLQQDGYTYQVGDSIFFLPSEAEVLNEEIPYFDPSEYRERLALLTSTIPLDYNSYVQSYINLYANRRRSQMSKVLGLSDYYFPIFEKALAKYDIPLEMKYLAIVESSLNPFATSPVGAAGIWQFMLYTGKQYGLKINSHIDERRDPVAASYASARYFRDMYNRFGDWLLVIASYNCGPGNVSKAINRAGGVKDFWVVRRFLPAETRSYVPAFIAATYVMNYHETHKLYPTYPSFSFETDTVQFIQPINFQQIVSATGVDIEELKLLNPQYRRQFVPASPQSPYAVLVPSIKKEDLVVYRDDYYEDISNGSIAAPTFAMYEATTKTIYKNVTTRTKLSYTVRKNDNIEKVANKYGCKVSEIKKWNKLKSTKLRKGQRLKIYQRQTKKVFARNSQLLDDNENVAVARATAPKQETSNNESASTSTNEKEEEVILDGKPAVLKKKKDGSVEVVSKSKAKKEEVLAKEKKSNDNVSASKKKNKKEEANEEPVTASKKKNTENSKDVLAKAKTKAVDKKEEPAKAKTKELASDKKELATNASKKDFTTKKLQWYKVEQGDTLWSIAQKYDGVTVESIKKANKIRSARDIRPGQLLKIQKA